MAENWWLILLVVVVLAVGIWWLAGGRRDAAVPPPAERRTLDRDRAKPAAPPPAAPEPAVEPPAPVVIGGAGSPLDVAPPPVPVADEARVVEAAAPAPSGAPDDLTVLKGIGPKLAATLAGLGVTRYDQIAAWTDADLARVDDKLGGFKGRPTRDRWIEQAALLAAGDRAGFETKFGRIEG